MKAYRVTTNEPVGAQSFVGIAIGFEPNLDDIDGEAEEFELVHRTPGGEYVFIRDRNLVVLSTHESPAHMQASGWPQFGEPGLLIWESQAEMERDLRDDCDCTSCLVKRNP